MSQVGLGKIKDGVKLTMLLRTESSNLKLTLVLESSFKSFDDTLDHNN